MSIKVVDIGNLKKEIISIMDTGYDADKKVCMNILNCIDRNVQPEHGRFRDKENPEMLSHAPPITDRDKVQCNFKGTCRMRLQHGVNPLFCESCPELHTPAPETGDPR